MKLAVGFVVVACVCHVAVVAFPLADPGRLLRVPRIYNALIRSDAKLQPSRAFPYSSPVFQPIELGPAPGIDQWEPQAYALGPLENTRREQEQTTMIETPTTSPTLSDENTKPKLKPENTKMTPPLTFYPRSFGYYQTQPIIPYGYPLGPHPYLLGSPYEFGQQTLFRHPSPSLDGYYGGPYGAVVGQAGGGYHSGNVQATKKVDGDAVEKSSSDSVGVRESEFFSDEENEGGQQVSDLQKGSDAAKTS